MMYHFEENCIPKLKSESAEAWLAVLLKQTDDEGLNGKGAKIIQSPMEKSLIGYCVASREGIFCNVQSHSNDLMGDLARKVKFQDKETALFHFCTSNAHKLSTIF